MSQQKVTPRDVPQSQQRGPTPQGTFDLAPPNTLQRMADMAGTTPDDLATLIVDKSRKLSYESIIEYLAMCQPMPSHTTASKWHPLSINSYEYSADPYIDDYDRRSRLYRAARRLDEFDSYLTGTASKTKSHPVDTSFFYALGETCFLWPPPPHLSADTLREEMKKKIMMRKLLEARSDTPSQRQSHIEPQKTETDEQVSVDASETDSVNRTVIYLAHYSVGDPSDRSMYREILLASPDGPETLRTFVNEVVQWHSEKNYVEPKEKQFILKRFRNYGDGGEWYDEGLKDARPVDSVILADQLMEDIITDVSDFLDPSCKKWYASHGLPRRRSYMFHGPPGTGKTSTIKALASKFDLNCCFLSMTDRDFSNQQLCDALSQIPHNALLVLEDVDVLFSENSNREGSSLTFSGLLNALDGVISVDGVITVMTTNHFERLNQSLVRGGRVDRRFYFGHPSRGQIADLFLRFYPDAGDLAKQFSDAVFDRPEGNEVRSIATLQQLFTRHRGNSAQVCLDGLADFCDAYFAKHEQAEVE